MSLNKDSANGGRRFMKVALSIAGSDPSGGAGIQADIKAMTMNGVYAMSVITALTAQNTTGVFGILESTTEILKLQIEAVLKDIVPDAVKIGMIPSVELINVIADALKFFEAKNIVLDPVMISTSGSRLINTDAVSVLTEKLFPLATVVTPNIPEAEVISGMKINDDKDIKRIAKYIADKFGCSVLLKGGHGVNAANDLLYSDGKFHWFNGNRIDNPNTHGTGCTLSSAIAANLAKGFGLSESVKKAKEYISGALSAGLDLGTGSGPLMHNFDLKPKYTEERD